MIDRTESQIMALWKSDDGDPLVSIRCITYNHEKYIAQCLDGFLMQETDFPFEIVVHDDASTDNTADIIRMYEEKYPHIINAIYEEENLYSKKDGSLARVVNDACRGKYIAYCEGDDFWVDKMKLQLQFDSLEANPDCSMSTCLVQCCQEDGSPYNRYVPGDKDNLADYNGIISQRKLAELIWGSGRIGYPFQTSSYFLRKDILYKPMPELKKYLKRDYGIVLRALFEGDIYYHNRLMSMWRQNVPGSWNDRKKKKRGQAFFEIHKEVYLMDFFFDKLTDGKYRDIIFPMEMGHIQVLIDNYDINCAADFLGMYVKLLGKKESKKRINDYLKHETLLSKVKFRLFLLSPSFCVSFFKIFHKIKGIKPY